VHACMCVYFVCVSSLHQHQAMQLSTLGVIVARAVGKEWKKLLSLPTVKKALLLFPFRTAIVLCSSLITLVAIFTVSNVPSQVKPCVAAI